jgi:hypothetical protein
MVCGLLSNWSILCYQPYIRKDAIRSLIIVVTCTGSGPTSGANSIVNLDSVSVSEIDNFDVAGR